MSQLVFMPGFDGDASLRREFVAELGRRHEVRSVSYPNRRLGTLDAYRVHAMAQAPVDWEPVLVAESFSGLVATRWAAIDARVQALVLCAAFARNPVGYAAELGASLPALVKIGPSLMSPIATRDERRARWQSGFRASLGALHDAVIAERLRLIAAEDVGPLLGALRIPVILLQFESDAVIAPLSRAHLESVCHNAHVLRLPGPHFALETRPRECAEAIDRQLRAIFPTEA